MHTLPNLAMHLAVPSRQSGVKGAPYRLIRLAFTLAVALTVGGCAQTAGTTDAGPADGGTAKGDSVGTRSVDGSEVGSFDPCAPTSGDPKLLRLRGTVWTGDVLIDDGEVFISAKTGKILCVAPSCASTPEADKATIVCTNGIITPGLINPHDHGTYDFLPRWKHTKLFEERYQWQKDSDYKGFKGAHTPVSAKAKCESIKWTELRQLASGVTAIQGVSTSVGFCAAGWVRNLDDSKGNSLISGYKIDSHVVPAIGSVDDADVSGWKSGLGSGALAGVVIHVGEGINKASKQEWYDLVKKGMALPNVALIHATGLGGVELAEARMNDIAIIWSPQSNLDLYGDTTRVPTAWNLGMTVALGPDWTPSGSINQLDELKCAKRFSDKRWGGFLTDEMLLQMVTVNAAKAVGAGQYLGRLGTGYYADIAVFSGDRSKPLASVIAARPDKVKLTIVGGRALYGDAALMDQAAAGGCEAVDVCGSGKKFCVADSAVTDKGSQSLTDIEKALKTALADAKASVKPAPAHEYGYQLWPLWFCDAEAEKLISCDVAPTVGDAPSATDKDGDRKKDDQDNCPTVWNPDQSDLDSDKLGDACDGCPLLKDVAQCPKPSGTDSDGDGVDSTKDNCPSKINADQSDGDQDGKGDACDPCPKAANPGATACPVLAADVTAINSDYAAWPEGEMVHVQGLVVTAVTKTGNPLTVWAQVDPGVPYGGIALQVPKGGKHDIQVGQKIGATGRIFDLFGLRILSDVVFDANPVNVALPAPLDLQPAVLGAAATALPYRSLLVQLKDVKVTADNADAEAGADYGEIELNDVLRVDDLLMAWGAEVPRPKVGDTFASIRGIHYFSFANDKLLPRSPADFVK